MVGCVRDAPQTIRSKILVRPRRTTNDQVEDIGASRTHPTLLAVGISATIHPAWIHDAGSALGLDDTELNPLDSRAAVVEGQSAIVVVQEFLMGMAEVYVLDSVLGALFDAL